MASEAQRVGDAAKLAREGAPHDDDLFCFDSTCYHAGGPLGNGDIEDVNGEPCVVCPWHMYQVALADGAKYYQPLIMKDGKMKPGGWKKKENAQRTHHVQERQDGVYVTLNLDGKYDSDEYGGMSTCGGNSNASNKPVHSKRNFALPRRSGHVLSGASPAVPGMPMPAPIAAPGSMPNPGQVSTSLANLSTLDVEEEADLDDEEDLGLIGGQNARTEGSARSREDDWTQLVVAKKVRVSEACVSLYLDATTLEGNDEVLRKLYSIDADFGDGTIVDVDDLFDTRHLDVGLVLNADSAELTHRPYTPVRSAKRSLNASRKEHLIHLEIRVYPGGKLGPRLAALEPGDKVFARPGTTPAADSLPEKAFPPLADLTKVFLFAGGSGITPILQVLQNCLDAQVKLQITIVCANKTLSRMLGADALGSLVNEAANRPEITLRVFHVLTDAQVALPSDVEHIKFVQSTRVNDLPFLQNKVAVPAQSSGTSVFAWCGPQGFMSALRSSLVEGLGATPHRCVEYLG
ncbi:NADH-cytochrome b5 reductase-like protein [Hondaea fermentalgiana]|uniref:NADH-cytochrome b5 reductase-like protein n=1 Tax=Hondaea fermentalgiana TaxID=2315210 RepID=A0A2R5GDL2_9STRA|nr:NADH-cytochrome b5 reductase-like protein [Hondaea fermentalgiana]|eukprot:GBG29042.1 NADH-cytochrome b5 reductase-like protein [Hondaea fermentalgiana]